MRMQVHHYDAFSDVPHMGNPAGVMLESDKLSTEEMQEIARAIGFNETAFTMKSDVADIRLRYFTPGHEMNLCGHGTMAAIHALNDQGFLTGKDKIRVETKAGILDVKLEQLASRHLNITMQQAAPKFEAFTGSVSRLAQVIGLVEQDIETKWPIMYGSTGTWTLLIPIKTLAAFSRMKPATSQFPDVLEQMPRVSIHPFCMETIDPKATMHARHFSSPYSGTVEDAVTGTASGVMGAYYAANVVANPQEELHIVIEQGFEVGRDGRVGVHVQKDAVEISGTAVYVADIGVSIQR
ncbi:isomerase [Listeria weihenstephanensis]|uniref:Isomerase n=2 Tax=Listeria weihenstephanensis TaxID=1006155 RepID=A0A1S7FSD0_9LIST|nr:PhzF family phenazine biosynthesis isomerase [Listeria weihenstephanensis]AQY50313.1 isomerase [Listeria weihenstephanensis]